MVESDSEEPSLSSEELKCRQEEVLLTYKGDPYLSLFLYELGEILSGMYDPENEECRECDSYLACGEIGKELANGEFGIMILRTERVYDKMPSPDSSTDPIYRIINTDDSDILRAG